MTDSGAKMTGLGKFMSFLLVVGLLAIGGYVVLKKAKTVPPQPGTNTTTGANGSASTTTKPPTPTAPSLDDLPLIAAATAVPTLAPPAEYVPKDNIIDVELSEYAGYAGLIVANGGLEPTENSVFFKKHGFKVRIVLSEEESWSALNSGKMAASATTVDVLAIYGKQFNVVVPAQIGFSRGADGIVVRSDIKRINGLKGKVLAAAQFTESEFFIRWLAQEANLGVHVLDDLSAKPDPDKVNLVFAEDAFQACDIFAADLADGDPRLAGCVTWEPKTSETAEGSNGKAQILATNKNLLIVGDILIVNRGFAEKNPKSVAGLVDGLLEGNRMVRDQPEKHLDTIARAFKWENAAEAREELAKVHLSNLPENLAFFSGAIDMAGSFGGIYQSAVYAYGRELIPDPPSSERFVDLTHLKALETSGNYRDQKISIAPIRTTAAGSVETDPLLSKDIRFLFQPNSATLDLTNTANLSNLEAIKRLLTVSPGSTVLLRGHVDDALVPDFRKQGGEPFVRQMALKAVELSKNRAGEIKRLLIERHAADGARLEVVGRGWDEPMSKDSEQNRRVEVQWFTVE